MPSSRIMMHQPAGGAMGSADEVNIQASELNRTMKVGLPCSKLLLQAMRKTSVLLSVVCALLVSALFLCRRWLLNPTASFVSIVNNCYFFL